MGFLCTGANLHLRMDGLDRLALDRVTFLITGSDGDKLEPDSFLY